MARSAASESRAAGSAPEGWLRRQARRVRVPLGASVVLTALDGLLLIGQAWLLARIIAAVAIDGRALADVWPDLWRVLAVFIGRAALSPLADMAAFEAAARIKLAVRARLIEHIQALGPVWARRQASGTIANTLTDAIESLDNYYAGYLPQIARAVFIPLAILVFVFPQDWVSGVILVITAPLIPLFMFLIGKGTEALNQRQWRRLARLSAHFFDAIEGLTTLKLFGASRREAAVVARMSQAYRHSTMTVLRVAFLSSLMLEFLATIAIAMVAVYIGFRLYYGEMHFLPGLFVLLLAPEFYLPLRNMGTQYHARMEAIGAAEQVVALLDEQPPDEPGREAARQPIGLVQRVAFDHVGFAYDTGQPVLDGIQFTVARGERVALVGASGAGKTTIGQLLLGFLRPSPGSVRVNDIDLRDVDSGDWLARVAWLGQKPTLFHGSIGDNIRLGAPEADPGAVRRAAGQANAAAFIEALPDGYDTRVGDRGQGLSGGEIQRIALARAFLKDAELVVLDEATASLDPATEALITEAIERLAHDRAMLVIAHRLATVRRADRILVVENGRIVEQGSHARLMDAGGRYANMLSLYRGQTGTAGS